ncbi:AraC family transcriptional regulator [Bradyrhizobium sp. USDA 4523]|uniref:helix-turn-helix transcriptional regulator n=1 Tax=unclassified Bradyrhizobium TaxID=2631580 RepID=UPI00209DF589|nr:MULTISPECIES: AraC family transcriptional regulator [unclassified Bradyrhizobium]MCP1845941.1 AraC family transcriptional regulator [Bradyrhizobium sp. USDA 4538]MCP1907425.1 AraC family transcriptional regulator [Bradyrhizobium sp. USDA 4537]MCP1985211.1 AraC family transcriptional regulator [Bradyrhizobium sp. USDA 4539]
MNTSYRTDQTVLNVGSELSILRTSETLGWPNINASFARGLPHGYEIAHRATPDVWIAMSHSLVDVSLSLGRQKQRLVCPSRRVLLLAPETPIGVRRQNEIYGLHVFLKAEILAEVASEVFDRDPKSFEVVSAFGFEDPSMSLLLDSLNYALSEPREHSSLKIEYLSRALAIDVLSKHGATKLTTGIQASERLTTKQARLVTEYIHDHLSSEILLNDLAKLAGLSRTVFIKRFKASFQLTPHRYLMETRIRRSQELLATTNLSLTHIAMICGFADQSHFSMAFKRAVGWSPSVYRRNA